MGPSQASAGAAGLESAMPGRRRARGMRLPRSAGRRALFVAIYALFCGGLVCGAGAVYWKLRSGVPLSDAATAWDHFYPELRQSGVWDAELTAEDGSFDVLLLGGSVLEPSWGDVEELLRERLDAAGGRSRLFNLGRSAHTSRDSLLKYERLADKRFDLVIVYDGINDVRMNNCPAEMFRDDYSHCSWYRGFEKRRKAGRMTLPAAVGQELQTLAESIGQGGTDNAEYLEHGRDIKTPRALRSNLEGIARLAAERGDRLVLLTYAYHLPADYTRARFDARQLDYSYRDDKRSCGAEMWGKPEFIGPVLDAQNDVVRRLAAERPAVRLVDQQQRLPASGAHFVDPCHLTREGSRRFVENLWPAVSERLLEWRQGVSGSGPG